MLQVWESPTPLAFVEVSLQSTAEKQQHYLANGKRQSSIAQVFSGLHSQRLELHNQDNFPTPPYWANVCKFSSWGGGRKKKINIFLATPLKFHPALNNRN